MDWPDDRGILWARTAREKFRYGRRAPAPELAPFVTHYWLVEYDLRGEPPYRQRVLPHPSVNLTVAGPRARIAGVIRGHFDEILRDAGWVLGVRFRPGGFRPFLGAPVVTIANRFLPLTEVLGAGAAVRQDAVPGPTAGPGASSGVDWDVLTARMDALLLAARPAVDPMVAQMDALVDRIAADPGTVRVDDLARRTGIGARRLQRLFAEYVGASPKWVIRLYRLHEAAQRAASGEKVSWAALAVELGYSDQAHLVRDFTALVGVSPARYARQCVAAGQQVATT
ncbi:DUF6597 domain-containing transcriptional factor [Micromonospora sonneratiae]|uniref:DUF6597 domain-containing transcriptional factor n=1 Tax=Micromonospora sonneratiae TaxID=1184706 RepID=A0ABW3YHQ5_9ACTN